MEGAFDTGDADGNQFLKQMKITDENKEFTGKKKSDEDNAPASVVTSSSIPYKSNT